MSNSDQVTFYREQIDRFGLGAEGVGWQSAGTQRRRFAAIRKVMGTPAGHSLVDAGCGFGDFLLYLRERGEEPESYLGLELLPEMVREARRRTTAQIRRCDILRDRLPVADLYVASGSMNRLNALETRLFIRRCWEASRRRFVFNLLEGRGVREGFAYHRPREIADYCRSLGAKVRILDGYLEGDFTVVME
jgi:SAM-dependent methyltransferase